MRRFIGFVLERIELGLKLRIIRLFLRDVYIEKICIDIFQKSNAEQSLAGDQEGRAKKMVAVPSSVVAPALSGALCAALGAGFSVIIHQC